MSDFLSNWDNGAHPLFLGGRIELNDTIHKTYPKLFKLYKLQKSIDWVETEVSLQQDCIDMTTVSEKGRELMLENLCYQWKADTDASMSIAGLFAPFVSNSELWDGWVKITEIENLHALTYSEIIRLCTKDHRSLVTRVLKNPALTSRLKHISKAFKDLEIAGAKYRLGLVTDDECYPVIMMAVVALYCLERLQFQSSFLNTFGVVKAEHAFNGIGRLVQKIMQDERWVHAEFGKEIIRIELATERGAVWRVRNEATIRQMLDEVRFGEYTFNSYLTSKGWHVAGCNEKVANEWVDWNAKELYTPLMLPVEFDAPSDCPVKFMEDYLELDRFQNANQEIDNTNYALNTVEDDVDDDTIFD